MPKVSVWLRNTLGPEFTVHELYDLYSWAHVDSTIMSLRPGLVVLNASRVPQDRIPSVFDGWDIIWYGDDECVGLQTVPTVMLHSKWIGMNVLFIDPKYSSSTQGRNALDECNGKAWRNTVPVPTGHMRILAGGPIV